MPVFFYIYGKRIRAKSKFAPAPDIVQDKKRDEESAGSDESALASRDGGQERTREKEEEKLD
jgi:DHA1 family multidrug resistance protein-like MFS transporter